MKNQTSGPATAGHEIIGQAKISKPLQLATVGILGMVMLFGAGFVQTSAVHNAAHDVRHSLAFPCH